MKTILIFFSLFFVFAACSVSQKVSSKYKGKGVEILYKELGSPKSVTEMDNGNKLFVYEKETIVRSTEISTGRGTLDPRISPAYSKVETFLFEVNSEGLIIDTGYEKRIEK